MSPGHSQSFDSDALVAYRKGAGDHINRFPAQGPAKLSEALPRPADGGGMHQPAVIYCEINTGRKER